MRGGARPPRARRPWPILCGRNTVCARGKVAARAAAPGHSAWEQIHYARGTGPPRAQRPWATRQWDGTSRARGRAALWAILCRIIMREGQCRRARGGLGPLCVGRHQVREGQRARGGPGPFLCGKTQLCARGKATARAVALGYCAWESTLCARGEAAARAAALAHSVLENALCARVTRARRPSPLVVGEHSMPAGQGRHARGGLGPLCVGTFKKCARGRAAARAVALGQSALGNTIRAKGRSQPVPWPCAA